MLGPFMILAGFMTAITAPGLIAQSLKERRAKLANTEGQT